MTIINKALTAISGRLPCRIINDGTTPYLERYYVGTLFGWRFYLHRFVGSDPDRGLHDHPWSRAFSIVLSGWYWEETRSGTRRVAWFNSLTGDNFHRVVLPLARNEHKLGVLGGSLGRIGRNMGVEGKPCWTLFFHRAGNVKPWGFLSDQPTNAIEGTQTFTPYQYTREGSQKDWWLTAPKGKDLRGAK